MVGPWAWAITVASDGAFWGAAIGGDLAPKLMGGQEQHGGLPGYHLLLSPMLTFPGCLLLPAGLILAWKARTEPGVRFALCWLIPTWLAFELLPTKLAHYTLPGLAPLFWLMAASLREPLSRWGRLGGVLALGFASLVFAGVCIVGLVRFGDDGDRVWVLITASLFLATAVTGGVLIYRRAAGVAPVPVPATNATYPYTVSARKFSGATWSSGGWVSVTVTGTVPLVAPGAAAVMVVESATRSASWAAVTVTVWLTL